MKELKSPQLEDIINENRQLKKHTAKLTRENRTLYRQREKYFKLFNGAVDPIILFKFVDMDTPLKISEVNEAACEYLGYKRSTLLGRHSDFIDTEETRSKIKGMLEILVEHKGDFKIPPTELSHTSKNGQSIPVEATGHIINLFGEEYILSVIRNIAKRKQDEKLLIESCNRERCLRERLEFEIEQRIKFTRILVHELKKPITLIITTAEILYDLLTDKKQNSYAHSLLQGAQNLDTKVDELLDVAKGEIGILKLEYETVDLSKFIQEIIEAASPLFTAKRQNFTVELPKNLPRIVADRKRLKQVIMNLLDNAVKYTQILGNITLRVYQEKTKNEAIFFAVEDDGMGMNQEEFNSLFQLYVPHNKGGISGMGIGLSLAKMIVDLHGGGIKAKSKPGLGSLFTFSIPAKRVKI